MRRAGRGVLLYRRMRIVFVGGGSGGHFYPLIAVAEAMLAKARDEKRVTPDLYYMGPDVYDEGVLFNSGISYVACPAGKMRRYTSVKNVTDLFVTFWGILVALWKLFVIYPDVIFSKGGYTSVPVVIAGWLLRIPIVIHESDARPGRANVLGGKLATYIAITYETTAHFFDERKVALTGIPIRRELLLPPPTDARQTLGLTSEKPLLFVTGGSSGAERINDVIIGALNDLLPSYEIVHQTGQVAEHVVLDTAKALIHDAAHLAQYHVRGFLDARSMHAALSAADLIISRAGSTTIYEVALHAKPAILVPIPEEISHDQRTNAYAYARTGAAEVMEEKNLSPHLLVSEITRIMGNPEVQNHMIESSRTFGARDAAERIADALVTIGFSHGS